MLSVPLYARIAQLSKILQGIVHSPFLLISHSLHIANHGHLYASALLHHASALTVGRLKT
ncbi:MAG TPA: hypothetical protein VGG56_00885, partial [Terracidiphilus sp.]